MKQLVLILIAALSFSSIKAQETATIASAKITFVFASKNVDGSIAGFQSDSKIDLENLADSKFEGSVAVGTLKTGNFLRDWSLRGGKYFNADDHPRISFTSTSLEMGGTNLAVKGDLTIKGTTKPITIKFVQNDRQLVGTAILYSSDFGINIKKKREDNKVRVMMVFDLK